jgi:hypothetical protein
MPFLLPSITFFTAHRQTPAPTATATATPDLGFGKPPVSGGTPTVTDAAELSAPGWIEFDPGVLKDLVGDPNAGTPFTFKYTTKNRHLQYLLASDGLVTQGGTAGIGDTYFGAHYLVRTQDKGGYDVAFKGIVKVPTASASVGGTGKVDDSAFLLVSRDMTKWGFHEDINAGLSTVGNGDSTGFSRQILLSYSTTSPFIGGRWQYTNELVYLGAIPGQEARSTTMHGFAYARHSYEVYSAALQVRLKGDIPKYQFLFAASFNVAQF